MNISAPAIRRPIATTLLTLAVALVGIIAYAVLPVSPLPQIDSPTIYISASLPGANPEVMASAVAAPLERHLGHISGVREMSSQCGTGTVGISLQFDLSRNINAAARDVQAAINAARSSLPSNMPSNPTYRKRNPSDAPIAILTLSSDAYDAGARYDQASTVLLQRLSQIEGVGQVTIGGGTLPAVRIAVDPSQLQHYGLSMAEVAAFLKKQNAHAPVGSLSDEHTLTTVLVDDQLQKAADYRNLVLSTKRGAAVHLKDVAEITDATENLRTAGYMNGKPSVDLIIFKQPGSNIIETVDRVKAELPALQAAIPAGMALSLTMDRTTTIRASLRDVEWTLLISVLLVILVVYIFIRDWRATLIPGIAVPVSIIGSLGAMYLLDYSLDNLSLMALTICTGFVIDDAIVVVENIARKVEMGLPPREAALEGAREIGFTVMSITISLVAVFIPILMMGGIVGRLFREFAVTLSMAILISMVLSLTTTPMLSSLLLRPKEKRRPNRFHRVIEEAFNRLQTGYRRSLRWVLQEHAGLVLLLFVGTMVLNAIYLSRIPTGFFPQQDNGIIMGGLRGPQDASFPLMNGALQRAVNVVKADPGVKNVIAFVGGQGSTNNGFMFVALKPLEERKVSSTDIVNRLRPKLMQIREAQTFLMAAQDLRIGGRPSNTQYQYTMEADSTEGLKTWAPKLMLEMKKLPELTDVDTDMQSGGLETYLTFHRDIAARLGLNASDLDSALNYEFSQAQVSTIYKALNQYHVVLEAQPRFSQSPDDLRSTYVDNGHGPVPLSVVSDYRARTGPLAVNHSGLYPSATISFNLAQGVSLSKATKAVHQLEQRLQMPGTIQGTFSGTAQQFQDSLASEPILILTAILAVYIVLGILYESFIHPITILTTLPSASLGAVMTLTIFNTDLNVISLIGIILLIGIVKKNAIMMIDFALQLEREKDLTPAEAIFQACQLRFRPILMTSAAAFCGALPLAFGHGIGSELRRPLGLTILGGLLVSQVLTLYTTPVVYLMFDRLRIRFGRKRAPRTLPEAPLESL
nr:efflux RND transporter permease subunit [uncultured Holophaga sp.]